ncbi:MAG: hypothetical protein ACI8QD_001160 [Cyclobacteriaceae bacterium]|jgi:hypothetical protein
MKNYFYGFVITVLFTGCTAQQIQQAKTALEGVLEEDALSVQEVAKGLKEALIQGTKKGASSVSKLNGYYNNPQIKIPFPPEVQQVEQRLRQIGLGTQVDQFVQTLNKGAEEAAKEAAPIFTSAIQSMTISDAWGILKGDEDAATQYLIRTTTSQLTQAFSPVVSRALDKTKATKYYGDIITAYNKIPLVEDVNPDLEGYATQMAINGLFVMIAQEEKNIRQNPVARGSELLKRVFSQQD